MTSTLSRRTLLRAGASGLALAASPGPSGPGSPEAALQLGLHRAGPARRGLQGLRRRHQERLRLRAVLGQHAVQAGHRARRAAARQPRDGNLAPPDISKQMPAWSLHDLGLPVPRRRPPEEDVQERRRPRVHQDGARPARHPGHHAGLLRLAPRQPQARQADPHAGRPRRHQAAHAARRVLAVPGRVDRRQPDARSPTPRSTPRCRRAPSTARTTRLLLSKLMKFDEVTTQFVLTGHVVGYDVMAISSKIWDAMKPDQQARFRAAAEKAIDDYTAKFEGKEKEVVEALQEGRQEGLHARPRRVPHVRAEALPRQVRQRLAEGRARAHQRAVARRRGRCRSGPLPPERARGGRALAAAPGRRCRGRADRDHVRVVPAADRLPLRPQPAARLDRGGHGPVLGLGRAVGRVVHRRRRRRSPLRHRLQRRAARRPAGLHHRLQRRR